MLLLGKIMAQNSGLLGLYGLDEWFKTHFSDEQQQRLIEQFNRYQKQHYLTQGKVDFKFANHSVFGFFKEWLKNIEAKRFDDVRPIIDDKFKLLCAVRTHTKIDDARWANEPYYKSWFVNLDYLKHNLAMIKSNIDHRPIALWVATKDNFAHPDCLAMHNRQFLIASDEFECAVKTHFAAPIAGCRCSFRALTKEQVF